MFNRNATSAGLAVCLAALVTAGCATDDPNRKAKQGALLGALAGAALGNQAKSDNGKLVGAALGGIVGYKIGQYQDQQQKELETALADELAAKQIEIQRLENDVLRVNLSSEASFAVNEYNVREPFYPSLDKIAQVVSKYDQTLIKVIGHTDNTGETAYNQNLSERRSLSVAQYLELGGVPQNRLSTDGRGELEPRFSNDTSANRRLNRRVEIDLVPVVKEE